MRVCFGYLLLSYPELMLEGMISDIVSVIIYKHSFYERLKCSIHELIKENEQIEHTDTGQTG